MSNFTTVGVIAAIKTASNSITQFHKYMLDHIVPRALQQSHRIRRIYVSECNINCILFYSSYGWRLRSFVSNDSCSFCVGRQEKVSKRIPSKTKAIAHTYFDQQTTMNVMNNITKRLHLKRNISEGKMNSNNCNKIVITIFTLKLHQTGS